MFLRIAFSIVVLSGYSRFYNTYITYDKLLVSMIQHFKRSVETLLPLGPLTCLSFLRTIIVLWRCNSYTLYPFNMYNSMVLRILQTLPQSILEHFHYPKKRPCTLQQLTSNFCQTSPTPKNALISFLSVWIYLFWACHIN